MHSVVFLIQGPDQKGLVSRISGFFFARGFNILHCQQHTDVALGQYFMRLKLDLSGLTCSRRQLEAEFGEFTAALKLTWSVYYSDVVARVALLVTKDSHCLYDLILRQRSGELQCELPVVISNHPELEAVADQFRLPYVCLPVTAATRAQQEDELRAVLKRHHIDLVVLAKYMQVLSPALCSDWAGRIINIHHAVLPAFQGANPYQRAYERGVKMIGATAHYATADLDQGQIIEQDVVRVTHEDGVADLKRTGRDIERLVLARAVKAHLEHRIIITGSRTVVFSHGS